jgi:hypothetical protein
MGDTAFNSWRLEGVLHVWHYPERVKGLEGWHLNADALACRSIAELIDRMLAAQWKTRRAIPVSVPGRMLVGPGHEWKPATQLLLRYPKEEVDENFWQLELAEGDTLGLTLGAKKLHQFRESLQGLPTWKDDFAIGPEVDIRRAADRERWHRERLWFWTKVE